MGKQITDQSAAGWNKEINKKNWQPLIGSPRFQKAVERKNEFFQVLRKREKNSKYSNINGDKVNSNPEQLLKYLDIKKKPFSATDRDRLE